MRKLIVAVVIAALFAILAAGSFAASNPNGTGQPSQTCLAGSTTAMEPGQAADASGSAFNENGGTAGAVYAGNGVSKTTAGSPNAVSQYDVACFQVTSSH